MTYLMFGIIGVLLFFILRMLVGMMLPKLNKSVDVISGILALVLTPIIVGGFYYLLISLFLYEYHPERDFSVESWQENSKDRHEMRNDIITSKILIDKSKDQLAKYVGLPDDKTILEQDTLLNWRYTMGSRGWGFGLKFYYLHVTFENGQSVDVNVTEVID